MAEEDGTINTQMKIFLNSSPRTIETYKAQPKKEFSKDGNRTIFTTIKQKKKRKAFQLNNESRNTSPGFYTNNKRSSKSEKELIDNIQHSSNYDYFFSRTMQTEAKQYHKKLKDFGQKSLHVLDINISNPRYP